MAFHVCRFFKLRIDPPCNGRSYHTAHLLLMLQASSLDFLREHGFDFNKFIYSGRYPC
jgi:hypothetical protein